MSAFNTTGSIAFRGKLASVSIRTREFEARQIAYLRTADGLKIDWESFVGWSDMSWEEFVAKKPTKPVLFRVSMKMVEYYNSRSPMTGNGHPINCARQTTRR